MPDSGREKRVVELSRPGFRQTASEHARTDTSIKLAQAIQAVTTVIAKLRDMGEGQVGIAQVTGRVVAQQAQMRAEIRALQGHLTDIQDMQAIQGQKLDDLNTGQTAADQKLDLIVVNQADILAAIAATHP